MTAGVITPQTLHGVNGVRLASVSAGIKNNDQPDLLLMELAAGSEVAAVFTTNRFAAAPVEVCKEHLSHARPRYLLINSGNANCGLGAAGLQAATACCAAVAAGAGVDSNQVLPFSTGVIAEPLPEQKIVAQVPNLLGSLQADNWLSAAQAILTTDTVTKGYSRVVELDGVAVTLTGIAKGSGMIRPDMATMLSYIATDAAIAPALLQQALKRVVERSFNRISVDGEMSTNDACVLIATGAAGNPPLTSASGPAWQNFIDALESICVGLAQAIVRDGEGATKFITLRVQGAASQSDAEAVATAVANSPLVKTAFFASDANWGRILAAVGYAQAETLDIHRVEIFLGEVCIVRQGARAAEYQEAAGTQVMAQADIELTIDLHLGDQQVEFWTCDLSYDYVRINAEYRT
jgi:glutamate N-acetyltransferase/amino-acid N-acetyltransferase